VDGQDEEDVDSPVASSGNERFYTGTEASVHCVARTSGTDSLQLSDDSVFIMASQDGPHLVSTGIRALHVCTLSLAGWRSKRMDGHGCLVMLEMMLWCYMKRVCDR